MKKKDIPFIKVNALIDTGTQTTAVSEQVVKKLNLISRGKAVIYTSAKETERRHEYDIALEFDYNPGFCKAKSARRADELNLEEI